MAWKFQFSRQNLLVDSKWIVIKERRIPVDRKKTLLNHTLGGCTHTAIVYKLSLQKISMMQAQVMDQADSAHYAALMWHTNRSIFRMKAEIRSDKSQLETEPPLFTAFLTILCVCASNTHTPPAAALHSTLSQLSWASLCSGLDKSLPTNYIMAPASKHITHGADRHIIATACHTVLASPVKSSRVCGAGMWASGIWRRAADSTHEKKSVCLSVSVCVFLM